MGERLVYPVQGYFALRPIWINEIGIRQKQKNKNAAANLGYGSCRLGFTIY